MIEINNNSLKERESVLVLSFLLLKKIQNISEEII
jgi:hypothetical protein